jgi:tetratricopeptide (TPR) repeat protein
MDRFLAIGVRVAVAFIAVLVIIGGYTVYRDRQRDIGSTPAARIERSMLDAVNKDPSNPAPRVALAKAYLEMLRFDDAIRTSNEAIGIKRDYVQAYLIQGLAWLNKKDYANAERNLQEVVTLTKDTEMAEENPDLEQAYFYLGVINLQAQNYDKALSYLKAALAINRSSSDTLLYVGKVYLAQKAPDLAVQVLTDAVAYDPAFVDAQYALGQAYAQLKQSTLAAEHYRLAWEASNEQYGDAKAALDRFGTAASQLKAGQAAVAKGQLDKGVSELELALAIDPLFVNANWALGQAYEKQAGAAKDAKTRTLKTALAQGMYKRVKKLAPRYPGVDAALKRTASRKAS